MIMAEKFRRAKKHMTLSLVRAWFHGGGGHIQTLYVNN